MPNKIKYSATAAPNTLRSGNVLIGMNDVEYGPTSATNFWNGIDPPNGGYCIYNPASNGSNVNIYRPANDAELVKIINEISSNTFTTAAEVLAWGAAQTSVVIVNRNYEDIVTDGLVLNLDAGYTVSYPRTGTTIYDISSGNNGTLTNGPTFNSDNGGSIVFDGSDDFVSIPINAVFNTPSVTFEVWANLQSRNDRHIVYVNWTGNSLEINSDRSVTFYNYSSAGQQGALTSSGVFEFNTWAHFVGTYDNASQTLKTYVNGILLGTRINTPSTTYSVYNHTVSGNQFGGQVLGKISIVRHYNRALSHAEIARNFNAQKSRYGLI
jgi:hypothetical protein